MDIKKNLFVSAALAGALAATPVAALADSPTAPFGETTADKDGCKGKDGCKSKDGCKGKVAQR